MSSIQRFEIRMAEVIARASRDCCPPRLAEALRYALFPGGGRVRPRIVLACAEANGGNDPVLESSTAVALELIHCASLVHDDMPCFDDAEIRRGKPTLHRVFGEPTALLVGDALISLAFEELARAVSGQPERMARLICILARGLGSSQGIIAGQAWESEPSIDLVKYHRAKTGALFEAAAEMGAVAAGVDGEPWREVGRLVGEAYQLADDLADVAGDQSSLGKPVGQDEVSGVPNAVRDLGLKGALARLEEHILAARTAVPDCQGREHMVAMLEAIGLRLCPPHLKAAVNRAATAGAAA